MDKYSSYADLAKSEKEDVDYKIIVRPVANALVVILAPHGGRIEPKTDEIVRRLG